MTDAPVILWFRRDLRLSDNPALHHAVVSNRAVIPVYIDETDAARANGGASDWWLHHSLTALANSLSDQGAPLILRQGKALTVLKDVVKESGAEAIFWNRRYGKSDRDRDADIMAHFKDQGLEVKSFNATLLSEPWEVKTKSDQYYKVFSPYWRAAQDHIDRSEPLPAPESLKKFEIDFETLALEDLALLPTRPDWGSKLQPFWAIGEAGAHEALSDFLDGPVARYKEDRNRPDKADGTSRLSPHLAFGEISPRQIRAACNASSYDTGKFMSEIGWREFSYVLLYHNPNLATENFKSNFDAFPWNPDEAHLAAWQKGLTGYPFVDAGMRELWATGYQHNRVRMVTASFLIKHLLTDWLKGEAWFWDTLCDADPANNAASWQWVAGSGADAAPYFRIFNPISQGEKFDPNGDYVRHWVPELRHMPNKFIHKPWEAPALVLQEAGVTLGETYPKPIVDHKRARERALAAYQQTRNT